MKTSNSTLKSACYAAIAEGLRKSAPDTVLDANNYVSRPDLNLIEGVRLQDAEADLLQGNGNELAGKFRAAHSSTALAVNTFARFKREPSSLSLFGLNGYTGLQFERKCPHWDGALSPPNLDVVIEGADRVVAIESKCTEPFSPKVADFSATYDTRIIDRRREGAWFRQMKRLIESPKAYRSLDAAQLVKHAFGLAHTFKDRRTTLLYLYWEPQDASNFDFFAEHRAEIDRFCGEVDGDEIGFQAMSYPELWSEWSRLGAPEWMTSHVQRLRERYSVSIGVHS